MPLVDALPDAVVVLDGRGRIRLVNVATERLFGHPRADLLGEDHAVLLSEGFTRHLRGVLAGGDDGRSVHQPGGDLDVQGIRRDGTRFPAEVSYTVDREEGRVEVVASVRDVSGRREDEQELRRALSLVNATLESTADGILVVGADGRIAGANERFVELWRIPADLLASRDDERVMGYVLDQLVDAPAFVAKVQDLYEHPTAESNDVLEFNDGRVFERYSRPQRVGDEIVGRVWSFRDVTALRDRERELVQARTVALDASRAKSDFLATMSHEIRTPMNGVIGLTGLLLNTELDEMQRRYAAGIRGAGEALLAIVDDILDFSKLEAGKVDLEEVDFSPRELVEELGVLLAGSAGAQGLEFIVHCDDDVPATVTGDPRRLRQALINLTGNAIKFTPAGEVVVTVAAAPAHDDGGSATLRFEVRDTGIGIDRDTMARLFEPFSQADASTTRKFGGTGLGLAISRRLVTAMGGDLDVASEVGVGSRFGFTLELAVPSEPPGRREDPPQLAGTRALVVDDNDTNRAVLVGVLEGWGVVALAEGSAEAALEALRGAAAEGAPYDLALLDLLMPGTDGLALAEAIAADPALAGTHLLILTSGGELDRDRARAVGVAGWVSKPVRSGELQDVLVRLLDEQGSDQASAETAPAPVRRSTAIRGEVLVAEDNPVNQMVALGFLEELGYAAQVVADGRAALAALEQGRFDAVLMDCHMPGMDGFQATRELRTREGSERRTPVIAMTAGVLDEDRERCLAAGMDDFVSKPIAPDQLRQALERWLTDTAPGDSGSGPVLLDERLDTLRRLGKDDGWGVLPAVIRLFLDGVPDQVASLRRSGDAGDAEGVRGVAHTLKGAAGNLGAERVVQACLRVEEDADDGGAPDRSLLEGLVHELAAAEAELRALLEQAP